MLMCTQKVPKSWADRWDCHSGATEELIAAVLTPLIPEGRTKVTTIMFICVGAVLTSLSYERKVEFYSFGYLCRKVLPPCWSNLNTLWLDYFSRF